MARFIVLAMLPMIFTNADPNASKALRGTEVCTVLISLLASLANADTCAPLYTRLYFAPLRLMDISITLIYNNSSSSLLCAVLFRLMGDTDVDFAVAWHTTEITNLQGITNRICWWFVYEFFTERKIRGGEA